MHACLARNAHATQPPCGHGESDIFVLLRAMDLAGEVVGCSAMLEIAFDLLNREACDQQIDCHAYFDTPSGGERPCRFKGFTCQATLAR